MKKITLKFRNALFVSLCLMLFSNCGLYAFQENRELDGFTKIRFTVSGNLSFEQGDNYSVKVVGNESDISNVITKVEDNILIIKKQKGTRISGNVKVYVILPALEALAITGSGDAKCDKGFLTENFSLSVTGSGDVNFNDLKAKNTKVSISGSGDAALKGISSKSIEFNIAGSGDIDAANFETKNMVVNIAGSGDAKVYAKEQLDINIVGSGSVGYRGSPLVNSNSTGSGDTYKL